MCALQQHTPKRDREFVYIFMEKKLELQQQQQQK